MVGKGQLRWLSAAILSVAMVVAGVAPGLAVSVVSGGGGDTPTMLAGAQPLPLNDETEARLLLLDQQFITSRTAGDNQLSIEQAGQQRENAAGQAGAIKNNSLATGSVTFNAAWAALGPNPIVQSQRSDGSFTAQSGRIGALAIRQNGEFILGAAQGGIWTYDAASGVWTPRTDNLAALAIGALAVAPSNDLIVYAGTGEGALSGDSYFGNGILKSTDGGTTWSHVSGDFFNGVSVSRLAVDPNNAKHLYAAVLRGRGGDRRVSPPIHSTFGIWESKDGAKTWELLKAAPAVSLGATDIRMDPQNTKILYASFWSDAIYKSTDGGETWAPIMNGLPANADFAIGLTRFALGLSHPSGPSGVLYTGFDWIDTGGTHHAARVFKSTDQGASWVELPTGSGLDTVLDYCGTQCFYDNVIEPDPTNPNVVFVAGSFGYNMHPASGGVFRSDDGGQTWKNLGWNMHPDFHALAFDPKNSANVLIGNDGGVWYSNSRGGRPNASGSLLLNAVTWQDLNGGVLPNSVVTHRTGLQISQFDSIATVPTVPAGAQSERFWGGTQDNGTLRKSVNTQSWFDVASGDGGQVLVDPTDTSICVPLNTAGCYVYGTYFGISPYRYTDGGGNFFSNQFITNGINLSDRSEFYVPFAMNQLNTNQLFLGTYRLYRTDNAKAVSAGAVKWTAISPDLTSGCPGAAPNGARNCTLSAIGVGGGTAVYTGSLDGYVYMSTDAQVSTNPTWIRLGASGENGNFDGEHSDVRLPQRPVSQIAVDRSNYRVAYIAYAGFNAATPKRPGHVFKTTNGGASFQDISGNLPDTPVNTILLDPSYPNTLYAGTDVGPFVTYNGGRRWFALGTGFPIVAVDQLDMNTSQRLIAAGTHGRGAFQIQDTSPAVPALVISKVDSGVPVGAGSNINYTITLRNIGSADATGVTITDRVPSHTSFVSADSGGTYSHGKITWTGLAVPKGLPGPGGSIVVHFTVRISPSLNASVTSIVNDGFKATSAQGVSATGSPTVTPIAPPFALSLSPASQTGGAHTGASASYIVTVKNLGFKTDSYKMSASGGTFPVTFFDSTCTTPLTTATTASVIPGGSVNVCVKVAVPPGATDGTSSTSIITATSVGNPAISASVTIKTIAVTVDTLLVDEDGNKPDTNLFYTQALSDARVAFDTWDLNANPDLPVKYMEAFKHIVWFTGNSFPAPITAYEANLTAYLNNGGHLFLSGQDILDGAAGTTDFVHNYLHVAWDGSEAQNDVATIKVHAVAGTLTAGVGDVPLDSTVLHNQFMDEITLTDNSAKEIFTDDTGITDGLSFKGTYRVVFLPFAFEEYGSALQKQDLVQRVMTFFVTP